MAREGISRITPRPGFGAQHDSRYFQNLCDFTLENCGTKAAFTKKPGRCLLSSSPPAAHPHANPKLIYMGGPS